MTYAAYRVEPRDPNWVFIIMEDNKSDVVLDTMVPSSSVLTWSVRRAPYTKDSFTSITTFEGPTVLADYKAKARLSLPRSAPQEENFCVGPDMLGVLDTRFTLDVPDADPNDTQVGGDHYKGAKFQPWDWELKGLSGWMQAAVKYITRFEKKNGLQDLEKAVHYIDKTLFHFKRGEHTNKCQCAPSDIKRYLDQNKVLREDAQWAIQYCIQWKTEHDLQETKKHVQSLITFLKEAEEERAAWSAEAPPDTFLRSYGSYTAKP